MEPAMTKPVLIPVERLTHETIIRVTGTNDSARVLDIRFDGSGYGIDLRYGESDEGYEEYMYVDAGGSVEFDGVGEPKLRAESAITAAELQARFDATSRATDVLLGKVNHAQGHVCQPVDESLLTGAVAAAIGVPALEAAE
jgi:hypothetical protein